MIALMTTAVLASFAGSLHCAGMCGPLLALVHGGRSSRTLHGAYQVGRLSVYTLLGAGAGALGHGIETVATLAGLEHAALAVALVAFAMALVTPLLQTNHGNGGSGQQALRAALRTATPVTRALLFGAATGLLPCGWLYAWLAVAASSGTASGGAAVMLGFGLGSVPALVATTAVFAKASSALRQRARRLAPVALALSAIAIFALRSTIVERVHQAVLRGEHTATPVLCHGG